MIGRGTTVASRPALNARIRARSAASVWALTILVAGAVVVGVPALGYGKSTDPEPGLQLAGGPAAVPTKTPRDPWQRFNRRSFAVGGFIDRVLVRPVARTYRRLTPAPLRRGLGNVINNLREPVTAVNGVLQVRPKVVAKAAGRFVVNSTVGVLGLFDVAGRGGLERQPADFGQTLGRYGVGAGPYLYLPLVGPTTLRDGAGGVVNTLTDPVSLATGGPATDFAVGRTVLRGLDTRVAADGTITAVEEESTDPYATIRSSYLQYRDAMVREARGEEEVLPDFGEPEPPAEAPADLPTDAPVEAPAPTQDGQ